MNAIIYVFIVTNLLSLANLLSTNANAKTNYLRTYINAPTYTDWRAVSTVKLYVVSGYTILLRENVYSIQIRTARSPPALNRCMGYSFDFSIIWDNIGLFVNGAFVTLRLSLIAIAFGLVIGIVGALQRTAGNRLLNWLAISYVEAIRNTPFLIQLFFIFFGLPNLGLKLTAEQAATLALAVNFGAYSTEIVRAGVESIHKGQVEAGLALGFKPISVFRHIVLTPALANIYPALVGQIILAVLFTSVVSQIAAEDLTFAGDYLNARTFRSFEIYFTISLIYLAIVWLIKGLAYAVEKKYFEFAKYRK